MPLKITAWNIEWSDTLVAGSRAMVKDKKPDPDRIDRIYRTLCTIDPDIFCLVEGPKGEARAKKFAAEVLRDTWVPVFAGTGDGSRDREYVTQGHQWIWFFVKPEQRDRCRLQLPAEWTDRTGCRTWDVHLWGELYATKEHKHYRHPQVLVYRFDDGQEMECIGVHLKSGYMNTKFMKDDNGKIVKEYLDEALTNRIKLATEARDVRWYITERFRECREYGGEPPAIMILGDCNDGESQDYFEKNYLFFSVIANLQGNVLKSEEYFYHGLFDFDPDRCWSTRFEDPVAGKTTKDTPILLDHILYSLPLRSGPYPLHAKARAGLVEHEVWEQFNTGKKVLTSDHRPVTITLT